MALGGMFIISNRTNNETFENMDNDNEVDSNGFLKSELKNSESRDLDNNVTEAKQTTDVFFNQKPDAVNDFVSLTGEKLSGENFQHNNMVPYFGSKIKGNYDNYEVNESIMDNMTGSGSQIKSKSESAPLFNPSENMNFAYGAPNMNDFYQSRVNPSSKMSNVKPWQEERVAPGLNKGYTTSGSEGYNSALDERQTYMPKSVDDMRVLTNPKNTYSLAGHEGPLSAPIKERGQMGTMEKHLPDRFYESGKERWFTTTGIESKQTARPVHINKVENRTTTTREYEGTAKGKNFINYSKNTYSPSEKEELGSKQLTPAYASNKYDATSGDFGAKSYTVYENNRNANKNDMGFGVVGSALGAVISPLIDVLRPSRKENVIGNVRLHGDVYPSHPKAYLSNQQPTATTNRQMYTESLEHHNIQHQSAGGYETTNDTVVPTARNETSVFYSGVMGGSATQEGVTTYDAAYRQTNNDMKEATTYNRTPHGNTQMFQQLDQEHSIVKQEKDRENNRMWIKQSNINLPPSTESCGLTNVPVQSQEQNRMEPDLLEAFKKNPYTHSLQSVA